jgi:hypothetical protein
MAHAQLLDFSYQNVAWLSAENKAQHAAAALHSPEL